MPEQMSLLDPYAAIQFAGPIFQMTTAFLAAVIAVITHRYTKRQSALALINQNNTLANLVNSTILQSEPARQTLGRLHNFVVGCPDDAILFMYLNYVHNTFRMRQIGAVSAQVWEDTLTSCVGMVARLRLDQVERLLARGYERGFQEAVLARCGQNQPAPEAEAARQAYDVRRSRIALVC